jgi:hypothetical protein
MTPPALFLPPKGSGVGNSYFLDYHYDVFFGLAKKDCNSIAKTSVAEWVTPNGAKRDENAKDGIAKFMENMEWFLINSCSGFSCYCYCSNVD